VCGCPGSNTEGVAANCTASPAPQGPQAVVKCTNGNCGPADPDTTCAASCNGTCIGKCCSATGKCKAASCDGNKINNPSGHEHECVVTKDKTNSGGQCPWSGQNAYGVKCTYLANCSSVNCWGYTTCAVGTCPSSAVGVFCIQSGNSDNFKICGCSGEGTVLPTGAAVAFANCTVNTTVVADAVYTCDAGFYCPTSCTSIMCPCGSYCPAGSTAPIACPANSYCPENSAAAIPNPFVCPAGSYCPIPSSTPKYYCNISVCPCGTYCPSGSTIPLNCTQAGFYCTQNTSAPVPCPCGSTCSNRTCVPTPVPAGYFSPVGASAATTCTAGTYCPAGSCEGTPCPCGSRCPPGTSAPQLCAPPYYCPTTGMSAQALCPMGYICPSVGMCNATKCPLGTFVSCAGKVTCDVCPVGRYCPEVNRSLICPPGNYCPVSSSAPTPCPAGSYCYIGAKVATLCTAGFYCPASSSFQVPCYNAAACPAGSSRDSSAPARRSLQDTAAEGAAAAGAGAERKLLAEAEAAWPAGGKEDAAGISPGQAAVYSGFTLVALFASGMAVRALSGSGRKLAAEEDAPPQ